MAKDAQSKKRKASAPEEGVVQIKKTKKLTSEASTVLEKKRKATEDVAAVAVKKSKKPKSVSTEELASKGVNKDFELKRVSNTSVRSQISESSKVDDTSAATDLHGRKPINEFDSTSNGNGEDSEVHNDEDGSEIDDQTAALLKGFESEGDEIDVQKGGLREGKKLPKVPTITNQNKKAMKRVAESDTPEKPGVLFVGHIPHGFYEHEMRAYFEQFGTILRLRLSRNPKTGASKHYAFIEFESATVAEIVAKTMDSYLLFNHILKVKLIPEAQVPETLFKGANKRFKKVPWNKIAGRKLEKGASEATWERRIEKEKKRREKRAEKMKEIGYEFTAPELTPAKDIAKKVIEQDAPNTSLVTGDENEIKAIEMGQSAEPIEAKKKKEKKEKKERKLRMKDENEEIFGEATAVVPEKTKKSKKKVKVDVSD